MVSTRGRGRGSKGHPQYTYCKRIIHIQENYFSWHDFPEKETNISKA